jgi:uncharacterized protein YbcI
MTDIAHDIPSREHDGAHGEMLAEASRSIVRLHKELYGKGPTKARSQIVGDVLFCVLAGGFTRAEHTLLSGGRGELVRRQREELQKIVRDRFTGTIELITGRRVVGFMSATDEHTELSCEIFVLEPRALDGASMDGNGDGRGQAVDGFRPLM